MLRRVVPKDYISVVRDRSRSPYTSNLDEVHSLHSSIWDLPEAIEGGPFAPFECHVPPLSSTAIEETLHGTIWSLISPLLTTGDVVQCRTVAMRWNVGCRYGELGDPFFEFLGNDPFAATMVSQRGGQQGYVRSQRRIIHLWTVSFNEELHAPEAAAVPCEVTSLGDAATSLMKDARIREMFSGRGPYECDDVDSMPSDRMSSDLGDRWQSWASHTPAVGGRIGTGYGRS